MCSFVVKLTLSQISLILLEFTHFIFTTINTHLSIPTQHLPQNTQILSKSIRVLWRNLSVALYLMYLWRWTTWHCDVISSSMRTSAIISSPSKLLQSILLKKEWSIEKKKKQRMHAKETWVEVNEKERK